MATKKPTPEPEVQPDVEPEDQPDTPRGALDYIREQWAEG